MRPRLTVSIMLLAIGLNGCASLNLPWSHSPPPVSKEEAALRQQERTFSGALQFLKSGQMEEAQQGLEQVITGSKRGGITDEALFRLALIYLSDGAEGAIKSGQLLDRLANEFPVSLWTHQAEPLTIFLKSVARLRSQQKELKTLRERNYSLTRDNREMRQNIERFKSLDLELEQRIRR